MGYSIIPTDSFNKELKRLLKKYPSLKADIAGLTVELLQNPRLGIPLGNDCYKIRMAITSKGQGKSSGARVITHVLVSDKFIYLLSIYDKSEAENISDEEILKRLNSL